MEDSSNSYSDGQINHDVHVGEDDQVEVYAQAYDWNVRNIEGDNDKSGAHAWCLNRDSEPILIRFPDIPVFCHLELPLFVGGRSIRWTKDKASQVLDSLKSRLREDAPINAHLTFKPKLYYFRGRLIEDDENVLADGTPSKKIKFEDRFPMILIVFKTVDAQRHCFNLLKKPILIKDISERYPLNLQLWETDIDIVRKMLTLRKCEYAQWFKVKAKCATDMDRISILGKGEGNQQTCHEYIADWETLTPIQPDECKTWSTKPFILVFDIETYSHNHKAFPNKYDVRHVAFMISVIIQQVDNPDSRIRYKIVLGDCHAIPEVKIIRVDNEIELIDEFCNLIKKHNPQIISGYNIFGFDNPYLDARRKWRGLTWPNLGLLHGEQTWMKSIQWQSSGYGSNSINYLVMSGRITFDLLPYIRRQFKLPKYDLNTVGNEFMNRGKHDVSAAEMFRTYEDNKKAFSVINFATDYMKGMQKGREFEPDVNRLINVSDEQLLSEVRLYRDKQKLLSEEDFDKSFSHIPYLWRGNHWHRPIFKDNFTDECLVELLRYYDQAKQRMTVVGLYCVEDSELVIDIFEKMNIWVALIETSSTMGVSIMELYTRGQQVRGLSQLYNLASTLNYVLDKRIIPYMEWSGGLVQEPIVGIHDYVMCWDFNSLYPNLIRRYNMCYTTLVRPEYDHLIPDDLCNVFEFDETVEVESEEENGEKKTKETKVIHYRFKFVKKEIREGILPRLAAHFINERNRVRKVLMKDPENAKDPVIMNVLEQRQKALKVSANSLFGMTGAQNGGKRPIPEVAMCITFAGRREIMRAADYLAENYDGEVVYGDTDSIMVRVPKKYVSTGQQTNEFGLKLEKEFAEHVFVKPMYMEYEKGGRILCIAKKKYIYWCYDKNGQFKVKYKKKKNQNGQVVLDHNGNTVKVVSYDEYGLPEPKFMFKGIILARRDNCSFQRELYFKLLCLIMRGLSMQDAVDTIVKYVIRLVRNQVDWPELTIIKGYGGNYKNETYFMQLFANALRDLGKPVEPGERLDYLIVKSNNPTHEKYLGKKMRLPDTYLERLGTDKQENIDALYYIEKVLMNCVEQLFQVGYMKDLQILAERYKQESWYQVVIEIASYGKETEVKQAYEQANGDWAKTYDLLKKKRMPGMIGKVNKARTKYITGKNVFDIRLNNKPIKSLLNAIRKGSLKKIVQEFVSSSVYNSLYPDGVDIPNNVEHTKPLQPLNIIAPLGNDLQLLPPDLETSVHGTDVNRVSSQLVLDIISS